MWKLLIADDEPKIRRGIHSLVERLALDFEIVAEAEDGELAFAKAVELEPDILLIDIRMPFLNGLELIERLNGALPNRLIIIISGHDEFDYAQAAVKLQVFDYLLKPLDAAVFAATLERARAELKARSETGKYAIWAREQLARNLPLLHERFFRDWVKGALSRTEIEETTAFLDLEISGPLTLLAARFSERFGAGIPEADRVRRLALVAMRTILSEAFPSPGAHIFEDDTEMVLAIMQGIEEGRLSEIKSAIERRAAAQLIQVPVIASRLVPDPVSGLCEAYEELRTELADGGKCEAAVVLAINSISQLYYNPEYSLEDAARELEISPGYLSRLMKRETGLSFIEYLNRARVKKAIQFMNDPAAKMFEIAERVGYRSQHYFSRAFRKVMGISPSDYKKGPSS
ncbi:MAG TPA: response regulator [Rectinemataceae bacterium]|nr:response regulator [Rectinemataceae bacterium]